MTAIQNYGTPSTDDISKLRTIVKRRSSRALTIEDREDVVSRILEDAVKANRKSGVSITEAMFALAQFTDYYVRPATKVRKAERRRFTREVSGHDAEGEAIITEEPADPSDFTLGIEILILMDVLDPIEQIILIASDLEHDTVVEIGEVLHMPRSTVHRRLASARAHMAEHLLAS